MGGNVGEIGPANALGGIAHRNEANDRAARTTLR